MNVAFRKVWRDLWNNKGRTLLVVLSIGVGVLAVGMITASNALISRQMTVSQEASLPSNIIMSLGGTIDEDTVHGIARLPGVVNAEGVVNSGIRWKPTLDAEWKDAGLIARADYNAQIFDLITLREGALPSSANNTIAVEFNHITPFNVPPIGGTIYFEVNKKPKAIKIGGIVRDPGQFPPPFTDQPMFYADRDTLRLLDRVHNFNQLRVSIPNYTKKQADDTADVIEERLKKMSVGVGFVQTQAPDRHVLQDMFDGVGLILSVMAVMSLGLSTILVINTINAVIAQQIPQIGIMKIVGGLNDQIAQLYLAGVAVYGVLSLIISVPIGALGGYYLSAWMLNFINVPTSSFEILSTSLIYQTSAGLITPLLAALYPIIQGVSISVRQAISAYGVGTGRYGGGIVDQLLGNLRGLPRMAILSLRNTFRRMGRVALTELTLVTAGALFMMVSSTNYSFSSTIADIWKSFGFDVLVGFRDYQRIDEVVPMIESRPNIEHAEMWIWATGKVNVVGATGPGTKYEIFLRGIPQDTVLLKPNLTAGRGFELGDTHAVLLNQKLAGKMGVGLGDKIVLEVGESGKSIWTIVGLIFDITGRDQNTGYFDRDTLSADLGQSGRATVAEIKTKISTPEAQATVEKDLRDYFKEKGVSLSFTTNSSKDREMAEAQFGILITLLLIMTFLIAIVGSFGLSGTLSINVLERRREIGVMRAVGASSSDVALIFMGEGLLLGVLSWIQAIPISLLAGQYFVQAIGEVINFPAQYHNSMSGIWAWLIIVVVLSLVASWLPARRATQISVQQSLAYE